MVGSMIATAIGGAFTTLTAGGLTVLTSLGTAAAFAINFAVSSIVTRVFGQDQQGPQDSGTRQQVPPANTNAIPIVYGDAYLGGTFVDAVLSTDQKTMYYVMALSCISPNGQFTFDTSKFYYGDRLITFDGTDQTRVISLSDEAIPTNVDPKINGNLFINLYVSDAAGNITSPNGAAAPTTVMGGSDIDATLRWVSTGPAPRKMNGLAFAIIKVNYNQDAGTTSLSPITFYAKHYLNSTGAAKPGDVWYDYITNKQYGGAVGWLPNGTFSSNFVDTASVTALNAYADQTITYTPSGGGSATQARYRINGVLDTGQTVLSNLDKIMTSCDSWMSYNAALGQWSIVINKAETATYAFNDNNIIGEVRVSATDITQSINQIEAKFPDKGSRDQPNFVNISTPPLLLYPNEPINKYSVTYDLCNDSVQAQYLANRILEQAREDLIVSFSTTYYGIQVDAGDVVSVTNSDYGWTNKLFRVVKVNEASLPDGSLGAKLELNEYSAAVYDDATIVQYASVPNSDLPSVSYFSSLSAPTVASSNPASTIPNFNISVSIPATGRVTYVELYYTTAAIPTANDWTLLSLANIIDGQPINPGSTYVFPNQVLPTGSSTSATYYFSYVVGNDLAKSTRSAIGTPFTWTPVSSGTKNAEVFVYTWATTIPTISGSSTYTWSTDAVTSPPSGWFATISDTATAGQTLWKASVALQDSSSAITSTVSWSSAIIVPFGYSGTTGAVARTAYTAASIILSTTPYSYTVSGDNVPATNSWGTGVTWTTTTPTLSAGQSVWQTDGIYNPTNNQTIWGVPYLSALKVGNLSAISTNTGSLTVSGNITIGDFGNIRGGQTAYNTGTGFFLGYSGSAYKFSIGSFKLGIADVSTDVITCANHGYAELSQLTFTNIGSISNINATKVYTVVNVTTNTFQITAVYGGPVIDLLGTTSTVEFTAQALYWTGSQLNISGNFRGGTIGIGSGNTLSGYAFSVNEAGVVQATNLFGGIGLFDNTGFSSSDAVSGYSAINATGVVGTTAVANAGSAAHGVRGRNNYLGTSGLVGVANGYDFYADGAGTNYGPFTGNHDILLPINQTLVQGQIVVDVQCIARNDWSNAIFQVAASTSANQAGARGVFVGQLRPLSSVTPPAFIDHWIEVDNVSIPVMTAQYDAIKNDYWFGSMNSIGEGQIQVCGENGNISVDTLLVTSSTTGVAMAQSDDVIRSKTVAKAREAVVFASPSEVKIVACIYLGG